MDRTELRDRLLEAALPNVVFDGWTEAALRSAAQATTLSDSLVLHAFPGGARDLAQYLPEWADRAMLQALAERDLTGLKVPEKVELAVRLRLEILAPHREAVRRWFSWLALPVNAPLAPQFLYRSVDEIWYAVGDTAVDFSFYTKRALLAGVFSATTFHWLNDDSEDAAATWDFLHKAMAGVGGVGKAAAGMGRLPDLIQLIPSPFRFARQLRRRATGGA